MITIHNELIKYNKSTSVALGTFDGLHRGHKRVITSAISGKAIGLVPVVFTFMRNPLNNLIGENVPELLSKSMKIQLLSEWGIEELFSLDFASVMKLSPEDFVKDILFDKLQAKKVCCGFNFHFGYRGAGDAEMLKKLCAEYDIDVEISLPVQSGDKAISSSRIRRLISQGEVEQAQELLGRPFAFDFKVVKGRQLGRTMGTPTINQPIDKHFVLPKFGVYASKVEVEHGKWLTGVTNIGVKPTVGSEGPLAETWIQNFDGDLYGKEITVELYKFIRAETTFAGIEELKDAILKDAQAVKNHIYNLDNSNKTSE